MSALTSVRRPGYQIFEASELLSGDGPDQSFDLLHGCAVEVAGRNSPLHLVPDSEAGDHSAFEADATDFPFQRLPYTQTLLSRLGDSIRSMALDAEVVLYDDDQMLVPHPGVATWTARRIKLDRYDVAGYDRPTAPEDYRSGGDVGSVFTALIPLFGSRQIELTYGESTSWTLAPLLSLGQIMLIRAPGLIEDEDGAAPDFRSGRLYPPQNNLLMTVMNRTVAVPSPNKFTAE